MDKALLITVLIVALAAGGAGALLASRSALEDLPIVAARATAEAFKAEQEAAKADAARAAAAEAWARASEARARATAIIESQAQMRTGFQIVAIGMPAAAVVLALALALAGGWWAWRRASGAQLATVYPRGGVSPILIFEQNGQRFIVDAGRGLGSVTAIGPDGRTHLPLAGSEELHAQLSAQSLAAAVIANASGADDKTRAAAAVGEALTNALATLPVLAQNATHGKSMVLAPKPDSGGELHIIRRGSTSTAKPGSVKRGHMAEFVNRGAIIGFGRREWAGEVFKDGTRVSQTLWAQLAKAAKDTDILTEDGGHSKLRASVAETLQVLGLEEFADKQKQE